MLMLILAALATVAVHADAQTPAARRVVFGTIGYATTADDEGLLGRGTALAVGAGLRVTDRLTVQAVFDRIPYHRDEDYLAFDGRVLFAGVEAAFQWHPSRVQPFVTVGAGVLNDEKRWTHRTLVGPGEPRDESVTEHAYTLAAVRSSGGIDIRVSDAFAVRAGATFHGLLGTGNDLAAHMILQPMAGVVWRW